MGGESRAPGKGAPPEPQAGVGAEPLARWVRDALAHLGDPSRLRDSPLAAVAGVNTGTARGGRGLQELLERAILELRPPLGSGAGERRGRAYALLRARYVEGRPVAEVCRLLHISDSEYYRRHARALATLTAGVAARIGTAWAEPSVPRPAPFVGRRAEMARLAALFTEAAAGHGGRLALVSGVMGVGKTRLGQECGRRCEAMGARFLTGRFMREAGATYGPWMEALGPALDDLTAAGRSRLARPYEALLARVFPQLAGRGGTASDDLLTPEDRRLQLEAGLLGLMRRLADLQPLVVLIDDLQWAPGLGIFGHLAGRMADMRVLIIATLRQPELDRQPHLQQVRRDLLRLPGVVPLHLRPLDKDESVGLVVARLGEAAGARLGTAVHRRTGGNPFFIEETIRAWMAAGGPPDAASPGAIPLPDSIRAAVLERVAQLGGRCAECLSQAAILGERFAPADLAGLGGLDDEALDGVLEAAVAAGVLREEDGLYAFADEHVREALYESVPGPRRRRWHLQAAEVIEAAPGERAEELAHHCAAGGDLKAGAGWSLLAGERRAASHDWEGAASHYRRALDLWERAGGHTRERADCCRRLGDLFLKAGIETAEAAVYLQRGLDLFGSAGDRAGMAAVHVQLGRLYGSGPDLDGRDMARALRHLEAARGIHEGQAPADIAGMCQAHLSLASAASYAMDVPLAMSSAVQATVLARESGDAGLQALASGIHGALLASGGRPGDGLSAVARWHQVAARAGLLWHADLLRSCQGFLDALLHPARLAAMARDLPRGASTPARVALPQQVMGACAYTGDFAGGEALRAVVAQALAEMRQPAHGPEPQHLLRFLLRRGDWDAVDRLLPAALAWTRRVGARAHEAMVLHVAAELDLARGEPARGARSAGRAAEMQRAGGFALGLADTLATLAQCLAGAERIDAARAALAEAKGVVAAPDDWGRLAATVALAEGVVRRRQGAPADVAFRRAVEGMRAEGLRWDEAMALHAWGSDDARGIWSALGAGRFADALHAAPAGEPAGRRTR